MRVCRFLEDDDDYVGSLLFRRLIALPFRRARVDERAHALTVFDDRLLALIARLSRARAVLFVHAQFQRGRVLGQRFERGCQLKTLREQPVVAEDVQAESRARKRDDETTHVSQVTDRLTSHEREQDKIVLLTLKLIHGRHVRRGAE